MFRSSLAIMAPLAALLAACGDSPTANNPPDHTPPTVAITSPAPGTVTGTVLLQVTATDNVGVIRVRFKVNTALVAEIDSVPPFAYSWNTTLFANGFYEWQAVASDAAGNTATSAPVGYTVGP